MRHHASYDQELQSSQAWIAQGLGSPCARPVLHALLLTDHCMGGDGRSISFLSGGGMISLLSKVKLSAFFS